MAMKCEGCKYYREGVDIDYVPHKYCNITKRISPIKCDKFDSNYTFKDWTEECCPALIIIILAILCLTIINLIS